MFFRQKKRIHEGDNYKKIPVKKFDGIVVNMRKTLVVSHKTPLGHLGVKARNTMESCAKT